MICAPQPPPIFDMIENACIYFFTAEYGLKFFTCWSVSPRAAGILPKDDTVKALELAEDADDVAKVHYGPVAQTWRWVLRLKNLIDLNFVRSQALQKFARGDYQGLLGGVIRFRHLLIVCV
jgi:hypothetical protein